MLTQKMHAQELCAVTGTGADETQGINTGTKTDSRPSSFTTNGFATAVLAYMLGLAAFAVVAVTGQFPWFMLSLAAGAAIVSVIPRIRRHTPSHGKQNLVAA